MARTLIVSPRLPCRDPRPGLDALAGAARGLEASLAVLHRPPASLWIGLALPRPDPEATGPRHPGARPLDVDRGVVPVPLDDPRLASAHRSFCDRVLWPVLHDLIGQLPLTLDGWDDYLEVNRVLAREVIAQHRPGDRVLIHDHALMLVPQMVRAALPDVRIGFFLPLPFPSTELFRVLPFSSDLLRGLLGADLIGFQTPADARHFSGSARRTLAAAREGGALRWNGRLVRTAVLPVGVNVGALALLTRSPAVEKQVQRLRASVAVSREARVQTLVAIDRLDSTRGIPRRLLAFEALLRHHPQLRERVRLLQIAVSPDSHLDTYRQLEQQVNTGIGRINGAFGTARWTPVHYMCRRPSAEEVLALYRTADVLLVTPVRDGLNLVAKEFVAARSDEGGVLVLSEFTGAARELVEAVEVNPYDIAGTAAALARALQMTALERRARMQALRRRVFNGDAQQWASRLHQALVEGATGASAASEPHPGPPSAAPASKTTAGGQSLVGPTEVMP